VQSARHVALIAARVERIRGLRFRRRLVPRRVSAARARREGLADLDRSSPPARLHGQEELLELLGLLPPGTNLRRLEGAVYGEQVAGFYDPRRKRLSLVEGAAGSGAAAGALDDITLAHELNHALEDQRFGIRDSPSSTDDAASAYTALVEGSATEVMTRYALRYVGAGQSLSGALGTLAQQTHATKLPPYLQASLLFPYEAGQRFVESLYGFGHDWRLVNLALRLDPPRSTEQVLHPEKWLHAEDPAPVRLAVAERLGRGWRRLTAGSLGEWDTSQLLLRAGASAPVAREAAAGWGGARYELWRRSAASPVAACSAPCRSRDALAISWRWDTRSDARQFDTALSPLLTRGLRARRSGDRSWILPGGAAAAVSVGARSTTLAFAPSPRLAAVLASRAAAPTRRRPSSSVGQSARLIIGKTQVRVLPGPSRHRSATISRSDYPRIADSGWGVATVSWPLASGTAVCSSRCSPETESLSSRRLLPAERASSGRRLGPKTISAITRTIAMCVGFKSPVVMRLLGTGDVGDAGPASSDATWRRLRREA